MKQALLNGEIVKIISTNGGWTTVKLQNGTEKKVRNGALSEVPKQPKETKMQAQAETKQAPTPPRREPAPAHFVGDVAPGKVAKIGETEFNLDRYFVSDVKTPTGRRTIDCADDVAEKLRGQVIDEVYTEAAEALETTVEELKAKYGHLNIGMQRMNLGNRIRGAAQAKVKAEEKAALKAERAEKIAAQKALRQEQREAEAAERAAEVAKRKAERDEKRAAKEAAAAAKKAAKVAK